MPKFKMTIAYDGTCYSGWQTQPNGLSIQEVIQSVLQKITGKPIPIHGAGRTDAGVHALGQVAHFSTPKVITQKSLNALLPDDIRITHLEEVDEKFHARFSAKQKTYLYRIHTAPILLPFDHKYVWHLTYPLTLESIRNAIPLFLGKKSFKSFANESTLRDDTVRTLHSITLTQTPTGFTLAFCGDGFLYKMVRNITGTLIDIGRGKLPLSAIRAIFSSEDRRFASQAAPSQGLILDHICY